MEPAPSSFIAASPMVTASDQVGVGTPRPMVQRCLPCAPAATAAATIRSREVSFSAEQASNRAPSPSIRKRSVKGVMTGRGAEMSSVTRSPSGRLRDRLASSLAFSAALSEIAVTETWSAATEILARGRFFSASMP